MTVPDTMRGTPTDDAAYDLTRNWGLPLYNDATPMDMRDGDNRAMIMLDQIRTQLDTRITEKG